ncbi:uncharacterized protein LOC123721079 [Papilio machaon]|uniref:uncharacterized protein LOC123721079 n=1 Tax=Papilio machaon TaxID=76193 RepID=UPI001E664972|nr:uncharacterized protein LOC123721079 [Papilio machaon]
MALHARNDFAQLPKIKLPTFNGDYQSWPSFHDIYVSLVHNNEALSDVERLHYLKSSVTAEAESLLTHIQITNDNYGHSASRCTLPVSCRICKRRHHSLLHNNKEQETAASTSYSPQPQASQHKLEDEQPVQVDTTIASHLTTSQGTALLATALVEAQGLGQIIPLRVLIDQGSQATFITEKATQLLKLQRTHMKGSVIGVGSSRTEIKHVVQLLIKSRWDNNFSLPIQAYVMPKQLTTMIPAKTINTQPWPHLKGLNLADPNYFTPGSIDLLLGVKEYAQILQQEFIKGPTGTPCAQKTSLGWILFGEIQTNPQDTYLVMHHHVDIEDILKTMWEVEVDIKRSLTKEEELYEAEDLQEYRLLRVTFGTASAPYLAVKTLQVAHDEEKHNPLASQTIIEDFYMDDLLSGADTLEEAITLAHEITTILEKGGFQLRKWSSNNIQFLQSIEENKRSANVKIDMNLDGTIKALGITWNLNADSFEYSLSLSQIGKSITKRSILSDIQKLFDPLGWIAPSIVLAKMLMQKLWLQKLTWDETVSEELEQEWRQLRFDFDTVQNIKVKRWIGTTTTNKDKIQLHGFSDASTHAYAAVVYIRTETNGRIETNLIAARTRVAPLKTISLPRLELCGALLLSKLMKQIGEALRIPTSQMYAWTDSSIVISWLSGDPNRWKPFVANRVIEIIENINHNHWNHVQSQDNPADPASRGMLLSALKTCDLWWNGPNWLSEKDIKIIKQDIESTQLEMKNKLMDKNKPEITYLITDEPVKEETTLISQLENFDNLSELLNTIVYCKRFLNLKKHIKANAKEITVKEIEEALKFCIRKAQEEEFHADISKLKNKKQVSKKSKLKSLSPFLDEENILRVGGRLRHADLDQNRKHPLIIGNTNFLVQYLIADAHAKTLHGGAQLMLCYLRSKYWILRVKSQVKQHVHRCLICARIKAISRTQLMGDLPKQRVLPSRPFLNTGVDFAGPFQTLMCKGRGNRTTKTYIAIFICTATKAIHIELVGDLTSEAFIGAFRRFVSRRGKCSHLWSDQGRNFVGADKQLADAWNEAKLQFSGHIAQQLATEGTLWHFIPAHSPHFGGLWEAGVKSIKYHLKRIISTHLTYEEMTTVLCQVEACLNSRPLCPIDDNDPDNLTPLTPGHFLIGEAPIVVPSPDLKDVKISPLARWQHTQKLVQDIWRRWQNEYLSRLQQRPKMAEARERIQDWRHCTN